MSERPPPAYNEDEEMLGLLANLSLNPIQRGDSRPPRTPPRQRATVGNRNVDSTVYEYHSPTKSGQTTEWSEAGAATQGVADAHVRAEKHAKPKKKQYKKAAYAVFAGRECGVYGSWSAAERQVSGASNCIFRGYATLAEAKAAYAYAEARSWTRRLDTSVNTPPIPYLPVPSQSGDSDNPLHGDELFDERWFVVYRGITPGVYRSHLECQLNTSGIRCATHESVIGREAALRKFAQAVHCGDTAILTPSYSA